ncbi:hypothetical protein AYO43_06895 [Nitrospira sp. SCGC AG-212-E16]|nr:hypothetical protein AYO43_06895 [Nitrospira sp. SCGC AG-212-E16]
MAAPLDFRIGLPASASMVDGLTLSFQLVTRQRALVQIQFFMYDASTGQLTERHCQMAILAIGRYWRFLMVPVAVVPGGQRILTSCRWKTKSHQYNRFQNVHL